jgi:hypothetical protein
MVKKLELDAFFFVIVGAFFGVFLVAYVKNQPVHFESNAASPIASSSEPSTTPTPTVTFQPTADTNSQISSDGTHKVNLKTIHNQDLTKTYEVSADDGPVLYTQTLGANETITLPFNAWEPQNRYFFIQENLSAGPQVLVFKGDGTTFGDGEQYLNLTAAYDKLGSSYTYDAATGWAGYDLIVINTKTQDGDQGASYWYELPYGTLLPLATKF